jgi:hypothetical protein
VSEGVEDIACAVGLGERSEDGPRAAQSGDVRRAPERTINTVSEGVEDIACAVGLAERSEAGPEPRNPAMAAEPRSDP